MCRRTRTRCRTNFSCLGRSCVEGQGCPRRVRSDVGRPCPRRGRHQRQHVVPGRIRGGKEGKRRRRLTPKLLAQGDGLGSTGTARRRGRRRRTWSSRGQTTSMKMSTFPACRALSSLASGRRWERTGVRRSWREVGDGGGRGHRGRELDQAPVMASAARGENLPGWRRREGERKGRLGLGRRCAG